MCLVVAWVQFVAPLRRPDHDSGTASAYQGALANSRGPLRAAHDLPQAASEKVAVERNETRLRPERYANLLRNVAELELSVRASNCFKAANIRTIADLVPKTE